MPQRRRRGPGRPPAASGAETRARIITAARGVFTDFGYRAATFQEVADRADLTRSAINHYFPSKKALFQEVASATNAMFVAVGGERAMAEPTLLGKVSSFLEFALRMHEREPATPGFMVLTMMAARHTPDLLPAEGDLLQLFRWFVTQAVAEAADSGELPRGTDVGAAVEQLVMVFCGMTFYGGFVASHRQLEIVTAQLTDWFAALWGAGAPG
ncbi:TetR/AcrR family transcriptional regulator [Mycolicibacillus parakoreensis]|uniref:TetR/AcrR family transcriptional regulator n=1 Tax=Mycolicibacillus parakoreensis TaxID=1069221 RepID=A0ABY3U2C2_9MYCO|nr:TetR/AcrR family transcriptional regulator [Mycolicibacillus parakoreensis]MCV7316494.1 TetR/AcrR family transcriptional regulator [Mycolicibacillus parakoreensis]ULN52725.1 TetR/AcrR family transcriptional regulator [Mycolicibacillus parakoreensis]